MEPVESAGGRFPTSSAVPKWVASLVVTLGRARLLRDECERELNELKEQGTSGDASPRSELFRLWTFLSLWLACLNVVVEGWEKSYRHGYPLVDHEIDELVTLEHRRTLRQFRNKIFHPEPYDHEHARAVWRDYAAVRAWADQLTDAFIRYFNNYLTDRQ
jgi:hypothetical protein